MGVFAYIKNGVKYKMNQFPGAYPANRVSYNGSDVKTALDELNADIAYTELATATANTSFGSQITELKTTFDSLSMNNRRRCGVIVGSSIFKITITSGDFMCAEVQSSGVVATYMISMTYGKYLATAISTNGTSSYNDYSTVQYSGSMKLVLLN